MLTPVGGAALDAAGNDFNAGRFSNETSQDGKDLPRQWWLEPKGQQFSMWLLAPAWGETLQQEPREQPPGGDFDAAKTPVKYGRLNLQIPQPIAGAVAGGYAQRVNSDCPAEVGAVVRRCGSARPWGNQRGQRGTGGTRGRTEQQRWSSSGRSASYGKCRRELTSQARSKCVTPPASRCQRSHCSGATRELPATRSGNSGSWRNRSGCSCPASGDAWEILNLDCGPDGL